MNTNLDKNKELANLIFPDITETVEDLEKRYPKRNLKEGAKAIMNLYEERTGPLN